MHQPFLKGQNLYLRLLEESDVGGEYISWLNDNEVTKYLESGKFPSTARELRSYLERFHRTKTDLIFAIVDKKTDLHIGNVTLNRISWINRTSDTGLMIGRKDFWGKGYAFEAWSLTIEYAFQRLGLRKITAGAIVDNAPSVAILEKLGFKIEGTLRQSVLVDGKYKNAHIMGLFRDEFHKYLDSVDHSDKDRNR